MKRKKDDRDQITIFEVLSRAQEKAKQSACHSPGSCDVDSEFRAAVAQDLKHAADMAGKELSRYEVAGLMSELAGEEITYNMICNWVSDSHENHNMPAKFLPAFILVTGGRRAIEVLTRRGGIFALPGPEALRAEIRRIDEQIKHARDEKRKREILLKEVDQI